jgi:hypothetical protein
MIQHFIVCPDVLDGGLTDRDIDLIFGPLEPHDHVQTIEADDLAAVAVQAGVFPSRGQARKNGLGGPVPHGVHLLGTKKRKFWVWSPAPPSSPPVFNPGMDHTDRWWMRTLEAMKEKAERAKHLERLATGRDR